MPRPALVSLVVLAWAGWGTPALGQGAPAKARAALGGGVGAEPDTTAPWRYYPLAVGNVWEYGTDSDLALRISIPRDTTVNGRTYFAWMIEYADESGPLPPPNTLFVRYDSTAHVDRALYRTGPGGGLVERNGDLDCPLDAPFDAVVQVGGTSQCAVSGGYDVPVVFGGKEPGTGTDTMRTSVKQFRQFPAFTTRFAAGIGLVYAEGESNFSTLQYYRVNGEERGISRFPTPTSPTPPSGGAALAVGPNPTGGAATVRLDLPAPADVRVAVYDVLGRRVATLASGALGAGAHALPFDAAPLASGVYIVRAEVGGGVGVLVRRLTVVR